MMQRPITTKNSLKTSDRWSGLKTFQWFCPMACFQNDWLAQATGVHRLATRRAERGNSSIRMFYLKYTRPFSIPVGEPPNRNGRVARPTHFDGENTPWKQLETRVILQP